MIIIEFGAFRIDAKGNESKSDLELQFFYATVFFAALSTIFLEALS